MAARFSETQILVMYSDYKKYFRSIEDFALSYGLNKNTAISLIQTAERLTGASNENNESSKTN